MLPYKPFEKPAFTLADAEDASPEPELVFPIRMFGVEEVSIELPEIHAPGGEPLRFGNQSPPPKDTRIAANEELYFSFRENVMRSPSTPFFHISCEAAAMSSSPSVIEAKTFAGTNP